MRERPAGDGSTAAPDQDRGLSPPGRAPLADGRRPARALTRAWRVGLSPAALEVRQRLRTLSRAALRALERVQAPTIAPLEEGSPGRARQRLQALARDVRRSFLRVGWPRDEASARSAMRSSLVLHLMPAEVRASTLRLAQTWGVGLAAIVLLLVLAATGMSLAFHYVPHPDAAYRSVKDLAFVVPYGRLLRNLHRWSAHALVLAVTAHMARVFLCGAYKPPREANWVAGVALWVLTVALSVTGELLPWDQRAVWGIGAVMGPLARAPALAAAGRALRPAPEAALLPFYALHTLALPIAAAALTSFHLWRVRADGGLLLPGRGARRDVRFPQRLHFVFSERDVTRSAVTVDVSATGIAIECPRLLAPRSVVHGSLWLPGGRPVSCTLEVLWARQLPGAARAVLGGRFVAAPPPVFAEFLASVPPPVPGARAPPAPAPLVPAWPHLLERVLSLALVVLAALLLAALALDAPLAPQADPSRAPDPPRAPWYLLAVQELAHHSPFWGGAFVPFAGVAALLLLPYLDREIRAPGRYFPPERRVATRAFVGVLALAAALTITAAFFRGPGWAFTWWAR